MEIPTVPYRLGREISLRPHYICCAATSSESRLRVAKVPGDLPGNTAENDQSSERSFRMVFNRMMGRMLATGPLVLFGLFNGISVPVPMTDDISVPLSMQVLMREAMIGPSSSVAYLSNSPGTLSGPYALRFLKRDAAFEISLGVIGLFRWRGVSGATGVVAGSANWLAKCSRTRSALSLFLSNECPSWE